MIDTQYHDGNPWVVLVALLGVPTADGARMLAADGRFTVEEPAPVLAERATVGADLSGLESLGLVVGAFAAGERLYAVGVADDRVAEMVNAGVMTLGVDLVATDYVHAVVDGHPRLILKAARVRAVYVQADTGEFAWS